MRRKVFCAVAAVSALLSATVITLAAPASAQYPPVCTDPSSGFSGSFAVGSTFTITLDASCEWTPGAGIAVFVNGVNVGTKTASGAGAVSATITAISATQFSVDDPVLTPARCGTNEVSGTGPSSVTADGTSSHVETFTLLCPGQAAPAQVQRGRVALTGANVTRWAIIAFGLVFVGGVFVAADRRKARSRS